MKFFFVESILKKSTEKEDLQFYMRPHHEFVQTAFKSGKILFFGPVVPLGTGGIFVIKESSIEQAEKFFDSDPFCKNGLVDLRVTEFISAKCNSSIEDWFAEKPAEEKE